MFPDLWPFENLGILNLIKFKKKNHFIFFLELWPFENLCILNFSARYLIKLKIIIIIIIIYTENLGILTSQ